MTEERYKSKQIDPEEIARRAEGASYLTDEDAERIASRERSRKLDGLDSRLEGGERSEAEAREFRAYNSQ